ncbi:sensor histidine kinase [Romboutsia weinsteinii]|uniref:histidine kinase n=1 Tax=Romboutsia weinsteinii TaxID=2020949 RepID=A0A371J113_9FIRM|nr:sensor histidine kinase [Romboutsia weinsteinii]
MLVIKMKDSNIFSKVYMIFFSIFILLSTIFILFILDSNNIRPGFIKKISILYTALIFILGILFVFKLKILLSNVLYKLNEMIDKSINDEIVVTSYDETILSSLEHKLHKYTKISKSNKEAIEEERNKIHELVADISHQTKTPIANIVLYSQLILENDDIDEYSKDILTDINTQSERLDFLIQSLIKMSRLENGIISPSKGKYKMFNTVSQAIQEVYINAENKNININIEGQEYIEAIFDSKWTKEAIVNILENAIKYTSQYGDININISSYELFKRIDISDNGIGIEESELNNIFKRFYRCKNANEYEGVGIGLYLTREIISAQGGFIKVSSKIGEGTTFSIFLPS